MDKPTSYKWRSQMVWGLILIVLGGAMMLDRLNMIEIYDLWHYWPLVLVVIGINRMIGSPSIKHFIGGSWMIFLGFWLYAISEGMISFRSSWPILIIFWGLEMIIEPILSARSKEQNK